MLSDAFNRSLSLGPSSVMPCSFLLFTESTDDDKVVAWHWEEIKGPLREEKVSADTPVLTLTSLVHGNYTFRYGWTSVIL